jgi:hypothetical protein
MPFSCQLKSIISSVGGTTDAFDQFIMDGGTGAVQMCSVQTAAEASGIAGFTPPLPQFY